MGGRSDGPMTIMVRRIQPDQAHVLRSVRLAALADRPEAFGSTHEREVAFSDELWAARAMESSSGATSATFLAWKDRTPVGIVAGFRDGDLVELVSMWTGPEARRRGVGRRLVDAVVGWAGASGATRVELWVTRGNDDAQRLYAAAGFTVTGDHQPLASDPCKDELRMVRPVAPDRTTS